MVRLCPTAGSKADEGLRFSTGVWGVYPVLVDADLQVALRYGVWGIPRMYLIGSDGRMVGSCLACQVGAWSPDSLRLRLDSLIGTLGNETNSPLDINFEVQH